MVDLRPAFPLGIVLIIWHMIHPIVNLHFDNNNFFVNILYYLIHDLIALSAAILLYAILCAIFVFIDVTYVRPFHYASSDSRKLTKDEYYRVYGPKVNDTGAAQKKWTNNFRSLEGLRAEDGRTIKSNTVYRCDAIKDALLDTSNLRFQDPKTIIDLRAISESKASPTILPQRSESKVINLPVMPLTKDEQQKRKITGISSITKILMCEPQLLLGDVHRPRLDEMAVFAIERLILEPKYADGAVKNFIKLAADKSNHPVCWHCTEGKDRSGALAALLLVALGVPI